MIRQRALREIAPLGLTLALVLLALALPSLRLPSEPTLVLLVDDSRSIGTDSAREARRTFEEMALRLPSNAAVVVSNFAAEPRWRGNGTANDVQALLAPIEQPPGGMTDLGSAIEQALAHVLVGGFGSIVLATDGVDSVGAGLAAAVSSGGLGVPIDILPVASAAASSVSLENLVVPRSVPAGEPLEAIVMVRSSGPQRASVRIEFDGTPVAAASGMLAGAGLHAFRLVLPGAERSGMLFAFVGAREDRDTSDNFARSPLHVAGRPRFARIGSGSRGALGADEWKSMPPALDLGRYDAIYLQLDSRLTVSADEQRRLADYVERGGGLVLGCAEPADAAALRDGPLEPLLPVDLEPPASRADDAAIVVLVDRSGSMEKGVSGVDALSVAVEAARSLAGLLGKEDRIGVIAFDVEPHVIGALRPISAGGAASRPLLGLGAAGGTDWGPALDVALSWLAADPAPRRQIVLVSDGRLAEDKSGEPTAPWPDGVSLSTISVGPQADLDIMDELSRSRSGRHLHVDRVEDLPAALRREAAHLRLPARLSGPFTARPTEPYAAVLSSFDVPGGAGGLRVAARRDADVALASGSGDPLIALSGAGWGRTAFIAFDPAVIEKAAAWSGDRSRVVDIALSLVSGRRGPSSSNHRTWTHRGHAVVDIVHSPPGSRLPEVSVRRPNGVVEPLDISWTAPWRARGRFLIGRAGEYVVKVGDSTRSRWIAGDAELSDRLRDPLWANRLTQASGGRVLNAAHDSARPTVSRRPFRVHRDVTPWLAAAAAIFFFAHSCQRLIRSRTSTAGSAPSVPGRRETHV